MSYRRAAFRAALAITNQSVTDWANAAGLTAHHVHVVLSGRRDSKALTRVIDDYVERILSPFIAEYQTYRLSRERSAA